MGQHAYHPTTSLPVLGQSFRILVARDPALEAPPPFLHPEVTWLQCALDSDCIRKATVQRPDLVLLETHRAHVAALQLCRSLRSEAETKAVRIAVWSARLDQPRRLQFYEAGADDVVTDPVIGIDGVMRLTAAARRAPADKSRISVADLTLFPDRHLANRRGKSISLSRFQLQLLQHLMEHPGVVFSRDDLADSLWRDRPVDSCSISTAINRLRILLSVPGAPDLIHTIRGIGYVLDGQ